jgi:hypothetical protein
MIKKKVCMLGSFAVGKTSLISRYVHSIFSETYHTTVGVKIDKKTVRCNGHDVTLMLWDLAGEDEFCRLRESYLRGSSGYLVVVDGTRPATLDRALLVNQKAEAVVGELPRILVLNKHDLTDAWDTDQRRLDALANEGWRIVKTSAKTGEQVEQMFLDLTESMLREEA